MLKEQIIKLRLEGKSYRTIAKTLNCAKSVVSYHLSPEQKRKSKLRCQKKRSKNHPYLRKIDFFSI